MVSEDLIKKYKIALDLVNSDKSLERYIPKIRSTLFRLLQPKYWATIDEVVWVESFLNNRTSIEKDGGSTMKISEFTKLDWDAYAGCERFSDGSEPLIAEKQYQDFEVTIIGDLNGIQIDLYKDTEDVGFAGLIDFISCKEFKTALISIISNTIEEATTFEEVYRKITKNLEIELKK